MRLVVGSLSQETNSFSTYKTDLQCFKEREYLIGEEVISSNSNKATEIGAFVKVADEEGIELLPILSAHANPGGLVTVETYQKIKKLFFDKLEKIGQFDGVLLALHGAMAVEGLDDPEGDFLESIRTRVGKNIPIVSSFDLHANFTKKMMDNLNAAVGYDAHPHIDIFETGEKAIRTIISIIKKEIKPSMAMVRLPMITATSDTIRPPLREVIKIAKDLEKEEGVLLTSIFAVQPWLDLYDTGYSVVVTTNDNQELAQHKANDIAQKLWESRKEFTANEITVEEAIDRIRKIEGCPIVCSDVANSPSGGAAADNTFVLKKFIDMNIGFPVALTITDPESVKKCIQKGVGESIEIEVGSKIDKDFSKPLSVRGYIKSISDGKYKNKGKFLPGTDQNMGKTVVLIINKNIYLVITELKAMTVDPEQFISIGILPEEMKVIIVKSISDFKANYGAFAKEIIMLSTPGPCSSDLLGLPFKNIKRPMFPWDQMDDYVIMK
jgi:microcystin degradation protein MlrC